MIWMELRCDALETGCYSGQNSGPMGPAGNNRAGVSARCKILLNEAFAAGWVRTKEGRVLCPVCAKVCA